MGARSFTYRNLIKCGHCGCDIVAEKKKGKYIYYHCTQDRGSCKENGWIRQEELDRQALEILDEIHLNDDKAGALIDSLRTKYHEEISSRESKVESLRAESKEVQTDIDRLRNDKLASRITERNWRSRRETLMTRLNKVFNQIRNLQNADESNYPYYAQCIVFLNKAKSLFIEGDLVIRRKILQLLISNFSLCSGTLLNTTNKALLIAEKGLNYGVVGQAGIEPATYGFGDRCSTN